MVFPLRGSPLLRREPSSGKRPKGGTDRDDGGNVTGRRYGQTGVDSFVVRTTDRVILGWLVVPRLSTHDVTC